ncbi:MAG: hypothetical protein WC890_02155 [Candidatus Margulisiibacteriota bacterium]
MSLKMYFGAHIPGLWKTSKQLHIAQSALPRQLGIEVAEALKNIRLDLSGYKAGEIRDIIRSIRRLGVIPAAVKENISQQLLQLPEVANAIEVSDLENPRIVTAYLNSLKDICVFAKVNNLEEVLSAGRISGKDIATALANHIDEKLADYYLTPAGKANYIISLIPINMGIYALDLILGTKSHEAISNPAMEKLTSGPMICAWQYGTETISNTQRQVLEFLWHLYPDGPREELPWPIIFTSKDRFSQQEMTGLFRPQTLSCGFETPAGCTFPDSSILDILLNWAALTEQATGHALTVHLRREENQPETLVVETTGGSDQGQIKIFQIGRINLRLIMPLPARIE